MKCQLCSGDVKVVTIKDLKYDLWKISGGYMQISKTYGVDPKRLEVEMCGKCYEVIYRNSKCCINYNEILSKYLMKGGGNLMLHEVKEMNPTMKLEITDEETDVPFEECKAKIIEIKSLNTSYGPKFVVVLEHAETQKIFEVFLNATSEKKLVESFGQDDTAWTDNLVEISKGHNKRFKKDMIVLTPSE